MLIKVSTPPTAHLHYAIFPGTKKHVSRNILFNIYYRWHGNVGMLANNNSQQNYRNTDFIQFWLR